MNKVSLGSSINLLGIRKKVLIAPSKSNKTGLDIYMEAIDKKREEQIDRGSDREHVFFYGEINLDDKKDVETIKNYGLVNNDDLGMLYTYFDYERGHFRLLNEKVGDSIEGFVKWGPCTDPVEWFKYNHCLLGKPKRVVVYSKGLRESRRR